LTRRTAVRAKSRFAFDGASLRASWPKIGDAGERKFIGPQACDHLDINELNAAHHEAILSFRDHVHVSGTTSRE